MMASLKVRNPRTGRLDYGITSPPEVELLALCGQMRQAQKNWQSAGVTHRVKTLQSLKQAILDHKEALIEAIAIDTGRQIESLQEVDAVISSLDRWCQWAPDLLAQAPAKSTSIPFIQLQSQSVPYGLVGVISPWNFPLLLSMIDTIPALLAGCAVVVKPSEITPRFMKPLMEMIATVPSLQRILSFVEGDRETGEALIKAVDLVCFTGGTATGRLVAMAAAQRMIPVFLELGGKDPAIVLESADLDLATSAILWSSVVNAGQSCLSIERIYVAESICDRFVARLVQKAKQLKLAYPTPESGQIGPIIAARQSSIITAQIKEALVLGAKVQCGGDLEELGGGLWIRPTVLTAVNHSMRIMTEETFGPMMPVMSFSTVAEAIQLANDAIYGLSASVFSGSLSEAQTVAKQIQAGAISINDAGLTAFVHEGEKQAFKCSGLGGSRMGPASLDRFLRKKALLTKTGAIADPWWFE